MVPHLGMRKILVNHQKIKQLDPIFSLLHINQLVFLVPTQIMSNTMFLKLLISNHIVDMLQTMAILICVYETISMWMTIKIIFLKIKIVDDVEWLFYYCSITNIFP